MMRSAAAAKIPPSRQDAVRSRKTFCGDRAVKLRLYGNSSRKRWMPAGVLSARSVRNSDEVKPKLDALLLDLGLRRADVLSGVVINFRVLNTKQE
jgi:hypothetical protein